MFQEGWRWTSYEAAGLYLRLNCPTSDLRGALIYSFIKDKYVDFQFQFVEGCCKTAVQQVVNHTICLKYFGGPLIERRRAKRFQVDWQVRVEATEDSKDETLMEAGVLRNISSSGAMLFLAKPLSTGAKLDIVGGTCKVFAVRAKMYD